MSDESTPDGAHVDLRPLVEQCHRTLAACKNGQVNVAAGVLSRDGQVFIAVQVRSRNCSHCSVCAEAIAIGMALTAGCDDLLACVSVVRTETSTNVWSPCGTCRELLHDHGIELVVVSDVDGILTTSETADLLPWP